MLLVPPAPQPMAYETLLRIIIIFLLAVIAVSLTMVLWIKWRKDELHGSQLNARIGFVLLLLASAWATAEFVFPWLPHIRLYLLVIATVWTATAMPGVLIQALRESSK